MKLSPSCTIIVFNGYDSKPIIPLGSSLAGIAILAILGAVIRPSPVVVDRNKLYDSYTSGNPSSIAVNVNDLELSP